MPVATTILAGTAAALSAGKAISDISRGNKIAREAREDRRNYTRQDLSNAYAGMSVPTRGAQLQREEGARTQAETSYLASQSGARGAIGGSQTIADQSRETMSRIGAQLEESEFRLNQMIAEDEARIRNLREQREQQDLAAIGQREAYGQSLKERGWSGAVSTLGSAASMSMGTEFGQSKLFGGGSNGGSAKAPQMERMSSQPAGQISTDFNVNSNQLRGGGGTNMNPMKSRGLGAYQSIWGDTKVNPPKQLRY